MATNERERSTGRRIDLLIYLASQAERISWLASERPKGCLRATDCGPRSLSQARHSQSAAPLRTSKQRAEQPSSSSSHKQHSPALHSSRRRRTIVMPAHYGATLAGHNISSSLASLPTPVGRSKWRSQLEALATASQSKIGAELRTDEQRKLEGERKNWQAHSALSRLLTAACSHMQLTSGFIGRPTASAACRKEANLVHNNDNNILLAADLGFFPSSAKTCCSELVPLA